MHLHIRYLVIIKEECMALSFLTYLASCSVSFILIVHVFVFSDHGYDLDSLSSFNLDYKGDAGKLKALKKFWCPKLSYSLIFLFVYIVKPNPILGESLSLFCHNPLYSLSTNFLHCFFYPQRWHCLFIGILNSKLFILLLFRIKLSEVQAFKY